MIIKLLLQKILDRIKILMLRNILALLKLNNTLRATIFSSIIRQEKTKLLKHAFLQIVPVISIIINTALDEGTFPNNLKKAEVIPVYKKSDKLNKSNYRPVSILPILAKVFEKVLAHQITPFLNTVFSCHLSAFRQGYGCQDTLLTLIENWRKDLLKKSQNWCFINGP